MENQDVHGTVQPQYMQIASAVTDIIFETEANFNDIFNGLTIALGAFVVDYSVDEAGNVDEDRVDNTVAELNSQLMKAAVFAVQQIKDNPKIITIDEFEQTQK